jgi:hypothetical protein
MTNQCKYTSEKGEQCPNQCEEGSNYCSTHSPTKMREGGGGGGAWRSHIVYSPKK